MRKRRDTPWRVRRNPLGLSPALSGGGQLLEHRQLCDDLGLVVDRPVDGSIGARRTTVTWLWAANV